VWKPHNLYAYPLMKNLINISAISKRVLLCQDNCNYYSSFVAIITYLIMSSYRLFVRRNRKRITLHNHCAVLQIFFSKMCVIHRIESIHFFCFVDFRSNKRIKLFINGKIDLVLLRNPGMVRFWIGRSIWHACKHSRIKNLTDLVKRPIVKRNTNDVRAVMW